MKTQLEKVYSKLPSKKVDLNKVELVRKPQSIFGDLEKLNNRMRDAEGKIDTIYLNYKNAQEEFIILMDDIQAELDKHESDLIDIQDAAQELGLDGREIPGFSDSADLIFDISDIANGNKKLYPII